MGQSKKPFISAMKTATEIVEEHDCVQADAPEEDSLVAAIADAIQTQVERVKQLEEALKRALRVLRAVDPAGIDLQKKLMGILTSKES